MGKIPNNVVNIAKNAIANKSGYMVEGNRYSNIRGFKYGNNPSELPDTLNGLNKKITLPDRDKYVAFYGN